MKDVRLYQERKDAKVIPSINENRFSAFGVISKMLEDMLGKSPGKILVGFSEFHYKLLNLFFHRFIGDPWIYFHEESDNLLFGDGLVNWLH